MMVQQSFHATTMEDGEDIKLLEEANKKIMDMVKKESDKALGSLLKTASDNMKTKYHRGDN